MSEELTTDNAPSATNDLSRVSQLKDASSLLKKVEQLKRNRQRIEREWRLNLAFYKGNQWVFHNRFSGRVESLPVDEGDKPRYRVRLVSNQILPGVQGYIAMLTKTKPIISATPDSGADKDIKAAQMAERLYEFWWQDFKLKSKLQEALIWSAVAEAGWWWITYDPQAGSAMKLTIGPDGKPILNDELASLFCEELEAQGIPRDQYEKTIYMGDLNVNVIPPFNVFPDSTVTSWEDAKYVFIRQAMSPDEIKARYGIDVKPDAVPADPDVALPFSNSESKSEATVKNIWHGYFKPTASMPKGRYVVFMDGPRKILKDTPWTLPTNELPLVKFGGIRVPGSIVDEALVTHARPLQKELNRTISQVVEHKNLTVRPQMLAPAGSLRQRLTNEPGAVFEFNPVGNYEPKWREMPSLPPYVFEHLREIQGRLDRLFNLQAISRGDVPPNVEAGVAIDLLQEAAVDQVAPVIQRLEESLAFAGHIMVGLAQKFYTEPRLLKIRGEGGSTQVKKFLQSDLLGSFSFHAEAGSGLPRTRAGRVARIEQLIQMGVLRADQAAKHLDIADLRGIQAQMMADEDQAYREHEKLMKGVPLNPIAAQQAMVAVNQGMNPETGQPLQGEDPGQLVKNAGLQPLPYENFQQHMDTHALFMKSVEYEQLDPQIQQDFQNHFMSTLTYWRSLPVIPEPQAVRTTVQLKGTLDPTTASKVMHRSGVIDASPEDLSQPPLDTWVTDDLSKTGTDSGNTHLDAIQKLQDMQQREEEHELNQAKAQHQQALAEMAASHSQAVDSMKAQHAQELHNAKVMNLHSTAQQKADQSDEMHRVKVAQAKKPKPKPKSNGG